MKRDTKEAVDIVWDYMQMRQVVESADVLILLGSRDDRAANYAASLLRKDIRQFV